MELELSPLSLPGIDAARPTVIAGPCSAETEEPGAGQRRGNCSKWV